MTYQINNTAGNLVAIIADGAIDSSTSLTLVGRKYAGYGEILQENLVKLLENFAYSVAPTNPVTGQIWYETDTQLLKYYDGSAWQAVTNAVQLTSSIDALRSGLVGYLAANVTAINSNVSAVLASVNAANAAIVSTNNNTVSYVDGLVSILTANAAAQSVSLASQRANIIALVGNVSALQSNTGVLAAGIGYTNANVTAANLTISGLTTNAATQQTSINSLQSNIAAANIAIGNNTTSISQININVNTVNANVSSANAAIAGLQSTVSQHTNTLATINANVTAANAAIASIQTLKAPLAGPTFTGTPAAPTPVVATDSTQIATTEFVHNVLPAGVIVQWYGNTATVPTGWALCNGQTVNGYTTPNLGDKFVMASGNSYAAGSSGGASSVVPTMAAAGTHYHGNASGYTTLTVDNLPEHNHAVTVTGAAASHTHNFTDVYAIVGDYELGPSTAPVRDRNSNYIYPSFYASNASDGDQDNGAYGFPSKTDPASPAITLTATEDSVGAGVSHRHVITADGSHTHTVNSVSIIPSYTALCYIMKVV